VRKAACVGCLAQERKPARVRARHIFKNCARDGGIAAQVRQSDRRIARGLPLAGECNALCDLAASFGWRRQDEIGGGHRRHLDMQVDARQAVTIS